MFLEGAAFRNETCSGREREGFDLILIYVINTEWQGIKKKKKSSCGYRTVYNKNNKS